MEKQILPIVGYGSQILREPTIEASDSEESRRVVQSLHSCMNVLHTAVGLAAPQINSNLSIFVMLLGNRKVTMINPQVLKRKDTNMSVESCMSIPGLSGAVPRNSRIEVIYFDDNFNRQRIKLSGFEAIIFQHEYDHLNGIMFTDRMSRQHIQPIAERLSEIERGVKVTAYYDMIFFAPETPVKTSPADVSPSQIMQAGNNVYTNIARV